MLQRDYFVFPDRFIDRQADFQGFEALSVVTENVRAVTSRHRF